MSIEGDKTPDRTSAVDKVDHNPSTSFNSTSGNWYTLKLHLHVINQIILGY